MDYYFLVATGIVWEGIVIVSAIIMVLLSLINYLQKRNNLSLMLFLIFLNYTFSIIFSWLSKVFSFFFRLPYLEIPTVPDPKTLSSWILLRISYYRITFCFIIIAIYLSYFFRESIFGIEKKIYSKLLITITCIFEILYALFVFEKGVETLDAFLFFIVLSYMLTVYTPFLTRSIKAYKSTENLIFRKAFFSLSLMSICYIFVLVFIFIDRVFILFGSVGYTPFYYATWFFVVVGIIFSYFGYLNLKFP